MANSAISQTKKKVPALPGKTRQEREMMNTFMGCDIGEWRASYLYSSDYKKLADTLVDRGWLQRKLDHGASSWTTCTYYIYALTALGKHQLKPREQYYF